MSQSRLGVYILPLLATLVVVAVRYRGRCKPTRVNVWTLKEDCRGRRGSISIREENEYPLSDFVLYKRSRDF
jgi:hypothetical protein